MVNNSFNCTTLFKRWRALSTWSKTYIHYNIVYNLSLHHPIHPLKSIAHINKTYVHCNIVYNSSLHHAIHALKSIAHMESHIQRIWKVNRTEMCMTKIHSKRNGSHSYRNVHDENPFRKKWIVIRTEICMTKT